MTAILCQCCQEQFDPADGQGFDRDSGDLCFDCTIGMRNGLQILRRLNVAGCFQGNCPDNRKEGEV